MSTDCEVSIGYVLMTRQETNPEQRAKIDAAPWDYCMNCEAPLIPCTCQSDCPGGMCSNPKCNPRAPKEIQP